MKLICKRSGVSVFSDGCHVEKRFRHLRHYEKERDILLELQDLDMVIHVHDYDDDRKAIVLRYIPHTLDELIVKKCLSRTQKINILQQIVCFLADSHAVYGVCHNDLKSKNILVSDDLTTIQVIDFEMATWSQNRMKDIKMLKFITIQLTFDVSYKESYSKYDDYYDRIVDTSLLDSKSIEDIQEVISRLQEDVFETW